MSFLIVLLLYQTVSARFVWHRLSSNPQTMDDVSQTMDELFTEILNDMKLDISFDFPQTSIFNNNNMNINTKDDLFSIPPFFQSNTNNFQSKPLFLMVDTRNNKPINENKNPSLFTLQQRNKVNGNTWRFTVTTNGNNHIIKTESWPSTPKMYLCNSQSCGSDSGIEMVDIINNFEQTNSQKYMHLVPVTTMQSMDNNMNMDMDMDMDMDNDRENNNNNWMDSTINMVKGCHNKMRNWYYGSGNDNNNNNNEIIIDNNQIFDEDIRDETIDKDKNDDILVIGMCIIMVVIILCGVLYAGWKYMIEKKERSKMDYYVAMHETDAF